MTPGQRERVREVVLGAIALDADARESYVRDACAGDAVVRSEVERLLRHCDGPGDFLSAPAVDVAAALGLPRLGAVNWREDIPASIWGCEIVRVLGRGGMGVVYEAVQEQPRRRVAIKVLHPALAPDSRVPSFEAQVLARLTHPGIAHVYAAGEHREGGQRLPYLVMELVQDARSIVRYASEAGLSIRARVELMLTLCEAVAHAHQRGIVHRDLKPGNVLVGPEGLPKIIDFGLARVTDPELTLTAHLGDSVWGTVACMSPEQLSGRPDDVDARADVYSLGVILYELLTGTPPFDLRSVPVAEAMRAVLHDEPPDPGSLDQRLRGDLSAITRKAMTKDREKRYQWVGALAQDLREHLAGRPISARPPGPWQRFARWIGRHPVAATGAVCAAVASLVIAATVLSVHLLARRPAEVELHPDGRLARLKSVAGHTLHVWQDGALKGVSAAELTPRPAALGGGRVAVIARTEESEHPDLAGHVAIYEISRPQTPIWTTRDAPLAPPPGYEHRMEIRAGLGPVLVADVFEESPGNELVVVQGLVPYSPECIRVFDLAGRVLYSVWHDGGLLSMVWLPDRRRLVLAGYCSAHRWDERGLPWAAGAYPRIVLALSPRFGHSGRPWTLEDDHPRDPTVAWCKWVGPAERLVTLESFELAVTSRPQGGGPALLLAEIRIPARSEGTPMLTIGLDDAGEEIWRFTTDAYKAARLAGSLPAPEVFRLLDMTELPPAVAQPDALGEPGR